MSDKLLEFLKSYEKESDKNLESIEKQSHDAKLKLLHQCHYEFSQLLAAYRNDLHKEGFKDTLNHFKNTPPLFLSPANEDDTIELARQLLSGKFEIEPHDIDLIQKTLLDLYSIYKVMGSSSFKGLRSQLDVVTMQMFLLVNQAAFLINKRGKSLDNGRARSAGKIDSSSIKNEGQTIWDELHKKRPDVGPWTRAGWTLKELKKHHEGLRLPSQRTIYDWYR